MTEQNEGITLTFIGAGKMAQALAKGFISAGNVCFTP